MYTTFHKHIPWFCVRHNILELDEWPGKRRRVWVSGIRRDILLGLPMPGVLRSFGIPLVLEDVLDPDLPNESIDDLKTDLSKEKLNHYWDLIEWDLIVGKAGKIACVELDRGPGRVFKPEVTYDYVGVMKCHGPTFFVLSTDDFAAPPLTRRFHRRLTNVERFRLQGYDEASCNLFSTKKMQMQSSGNAHPLHMLGKVVLPLLSAVQQCGAVKLPGDIGHSRLTLQEMINLSPLKSELQQELETNVAEAAEETHAETNVAKTFFAKARANYLQPHRDVIPKLLNAKNRKAIEEFSADVLLEASRTTATKRKADLDADDLRSLERAVTRRPEEPLKLSDKKAIAEQVRAARAGCL